MTRDEQLVFGFFMTYNFNSYVGVEYVDQDAVLVLVSEKTLTTPIYSATVRIAVRLLLLPSPVCPTDGVRVDTLLL